MAQQSRSRDQEKFMLRLPDGMRERIAAEAEKNNRSMNAEFVARLESTFKTIDHDDALVEASLSKIQPSAGEELRALLVRSREIQTEADQIDAALLNMQAAMTAGAIFEDYRSKIPGFARGAETFEDSQQLLLIAKFGLSTALKTLNERLTVLLESRRAAQRWLSEIDQEKQIPVDD